MDARLRGHDDLKIAARHRMSIDDFITVTEVDDGPGLADALFERAYKTKVPDFPHHIVAFYHRGDGTKVPVSYVHFTDCGDIFLAGGAATDGTLLRAMTPEQQAALNAYGGLMLATLRHGFALYGPRGEAIFTCCGDKRALETTPKLGFIETGIQYLLVNWLQTTDPKRRREMLAKAKNFMPF
jgi:hypothetical protein